MLGVWDVCSFEDVTLVEFMPLVLTCQVVIATGNSGLWFCAPCYVWCLLGAVTLFVCGFYFSWTENDQSFPFFRTRLGHKGSRGPESDIQTHTVHVWWGHLEAAEPQRRQEEGPNLLVLTHWCGMLQTRSWIVHLLCSYWVKPMARSLKGNKMLTYSWLVWHFQEVWESTVHHLANSFKAQPDHFVTHF